MQQLGEKPIISTASKPANTGAAAPWLQPAKTSQTQPWMLKQTAGAPGTASASVGAPGTQPTPAAPVLGSTPATAYPPPTAATYGGYGAQAWGAGGAQQDWSAQYGAYYAGWDQSGAAAAAPGSEYQYAQYAAAAPGTAIDPTTGYPTSAAPGDYSYQYPGYNGSTNPPQQ